MQTPAAEPRTTLEASTSASSPPNQPPPAATPAGVTAPGLKVRQPTRSTEEAGQGWPGGSASAAEQLPPDPLEGNTGTRSASEDPDTAPLKLKKRPLSEVFRGLVLGASAAIHQALARTELEQAHGVWLMAEDEAAGVADPLASIAGRRAGGAVVNADAADLISAGVATLGYLISNAVKAFQLRRAIRGMHRAGVRTETTDPTQGEAA